MKLDSFRIVRHSTTKPGTLICLCPCCGDKRGHVELVEARSVWYCFRCGKGGKVQRSGNGGSFKAKSVVKAPRPVPADFSDFATPIPQNGRHYEYLKSRGLREQEIKELDPRLGPEVFRVYFPVLGWTGVFEYVVGRAINARCSKDFRWQFPSWGGRGKSQFMWGAHRISDRPDRVVIVEGVLDAVWGQDRLAVFGTTISRFQLSFLQSIIPNEIIIALDPGEDEKANRMALELASKFTCSIWIASLPGDKDLGDLGVYGEKFICQTATRVI